MDKYEKLNLTKEEFENIELSKAGFTRAEIEEMDRRSLKPFISRDKFLEKFL